MMATRLEVTPTKEVIDPTTGQLIKIYYACPVLDAAGYRWGNTEPLERMEEIFNQFLEQEDAYLHEWDGESFYRLAEEANGVDLAIKAGKTSVLINPLS